jgi:hypothetical protein
MGNSPYSAPRFSNADAIAARPGRERLMTSAAGIKPHLSSLRRAKTAGSVEGPPEHDLPSRRCNGFECG